MLARAAFRALRLTGIKCTAWKACPTIGHLNSDSFKSTATRRGIAPTIAGASAALRSEEHTSELQSQSNLVCRLLLEKKKKRRTRLFDHHQHLSPGLKRLSAHLAR